jgi:HK97 gp10 family phage protein
VAFQTKYRIDGLDTLLRRLDGLKRSLKTRILRAATRAGASLYNKAAKAAVKPGRTRDAETRTGLLKDSLGIKMTVRRSGTAVAVIGPRVGFKKQIGLTTRAGKGGPVGTPIYEDPANIAHLVEFGHGGPHPAPPHPFMRPAWDSTKGQVLRVMADKIATGLAKAEG